MKLIGKINHFRADPSGWVGSVVMLIFSLIAFSRWQETHFIFFLLLVLRDLSACWFLLTRRQTAKASFGWQDVLAYTSSGMPFIYLSSSDTVSSQLLMIASILSVIGFAISTLALFELGGSFGVSPANRGRVSTGVYRLMGHPMYTGYVIAELSFIILNFKNLYIFAASLGMYLWRAKLESRTLCR